MSGALEKNHKINNAQCFALDSVEIEHQLKQFWDQNKCNEKSKTLSVEDQACIDFYKRTVKRNS